MTDTIREILARYGVNPETVPLHGEDVTPLGEALERRESEVIAGVGLAMGIRIREAIVVADKRAEERAPDLADWVAAACRSRLGEPELRCYVPHEDDSIRLCFADGTDVEIMNRHDGLSARVDKIGRVFRKTATPAELRAELDRIAGGGS